MSVSNIIWIQARQPEIIERMKPLQRTRVVTSDSGNFHSPILGGEWNAELGKMIALLHLAQTLFRHGSGLRLRVSLDQIIQRLAG